MDKTLSSIRCRLHSRCLAISRRPCGRLLATVIVLLQLTHGIVESLNCNMRAGSSCVCDMDDGSGDFIDLTPVSKNDKTAFFTGVSCDRYTYSFNPCYAYVDGKCTDNVASCQSGGATISKQQGAKIDMSANPPTLTLTGGDAFPPYGNRLSVLSLQCDQGTDHEMTCSGDKVKGTYTFNLKSKYSCVQKPPTRQTTGAPPPVPTTPQRHKTKDNPIGLGTIMDISLLVVLMVYLSAGFAFMFVYRGERGLPAIPNYPFWSMLPGLIKEGVMFLISKVRSARGGKSGYDSL